MMINSLGPNCLQRFNQQVTKVGESQGIFCPSPGAEFQPHFQSKIATFFPMPCLFFPIKKSKKKQKKKQKLFFTFLETTTTTYEKQ